MRRFIKDPSSVIVRANMHYIVNGDNNELNEALQEEQKYYCAYTEKIISSTDLIEIDHFDPTLKGKPEDCYKNWYAIVAKWNRKKSDKWAVYQPILHPSDSTFYHRIWFADGIFEYKPSDTEAFNLVSLLDLNNYEITKERQKYIERMKDLQSSLGDEQFVNYLLKHPQDYYFGSAFEWAFGFAIINI